MHMVAGKAYAFVSPANPLQAILQQMENIRASRCLHYSHIFSSMYCNEACQCQSWATKEFQQAITATKLLAASSMYACLHVKLICVWLKCGRQQFNKTVCLFPLRRPGCHHSSPCRSIAMLCVQKQVASCVNGLLSISHRSGDRTAGVQTWDVDIPSLMGTECAALIATSNTSGGDALLVLLVTLSSFSGPILPACRRPFSHN